MQLKAVREQGKESVVRAQAQQPSSLAAHTQPGGITTSLLHLQRTHGNRFVQRLLNGLTIQRKWACDGTCDHCQMESVQQEANPIQHVLQRKGSGQPLERGMRTLMETRFGEDFSRVRVHTDAHAAETAGQLNAIAYTVGRDIFFAARQYRPQTQEGKKLLAHELAHVVQQTWADRHQTETVNDSVNTFEAEADRAAALVSAGQLIHMSSTGIPPSVQRQAGTCPVPPITPITDPDAQRFEARARQGGGPVFLNPRLQAAANNLVNLIQTEPGGRASITSVYRPQAYQEHLYEVWDKARQLRNNTTPMCAPVRRAVNQEMTMHGLSIDRPVAARASRHTNRDAVDIAWALPNAPDRDARINQLAAQAGLTRPLPQGDPIHFVLTR